MPTRAVTPSAPAAELETPGSMDESLETGFLSEDPHYRLTGELPEAKTKSSAKDEASAASAKTSEKSADTGEASAASTDADTAAASAAADAAEEKEASEAKGPAQSKTPQTSESRWAKITRENREMRERLARLEGQRSAESKRDTEQTSQPAAEAKAASTANPKPKIDDLDEKTGKAKYATYSEFEDAKDEWLRKETLREFQETSAKTAREQELQRAERTLAEGFAKRLEPAQKKYADFDQVALNPDLVIPKGSVTDGFLLDSPHAGEVLYHLGQHPEILEGFYRNHDPKTGKYENKITPFAQARELTKIELQVAGASEKKDEKSSAKPVSQAPRPPHQVSGKGTVAKDAVEQAVEDNDSETYMREANARDPRLRALQKGK